MTIDLRFESDYLPVLKKLQVNDEGMLQFMRHSLDKFTRYLDLPGRDLSLHAYGSNPQNPVATEDYVIPGTLQQAVDSINPENDIKVFIANNRTGNPYLAREEFSAAPDIVLHGRQLKLDTLVHIKNSMAGSAIAAKRKGSTETGESRV
jgi:hypothetical protein